MICSAIPTSGPTDHRRGGGHRSGDERIHPPRLLGADVVVTDGQAPARFGGENMKDVAGYDTKRLYIGGPNAFGTISTAIFKITVRT